MAGAYRVDVTEKRLIEGFATERAQQKRPGNEWKEGNL